MRKILVASLAVALLIGFVASAKADWVGDVFYAADSYRFVCTDSSDKSEPYRGYFEVTADSTSVGVLLTFIANEAGAVFGWDDNKFKDALIVDSAGLFDTSAHKYETRTISGVTYQNAIYLGNGVMPAEYELVFASGMAWVDFAMAVESEDFIFIGSHIQEIPQTLNKGIFTWDGVGGKDPDTKQATTTPEPATLLILGLGATGAGFATRRRMKK